MTDNNIPFDPIAWANINENNSGKPAESNGMTSQVVYPQTDTEAEICEVARRIIERGVDITAGYSNWLTLGFALADALGEGGRSLYHELSAMNGGYNHSECDRQYTACLKGHGRGVTIRSFFQMAKNGGIDLAEMAREKLRQPPAPAIPPTTNNMAETEKNSVFAGFDNERRLTEVAEVAENRSESANGYTFSDKLRADDLDHITRMIFDHHHAEPAKCDAMLLGALNVISGLMGGANGSPAQRAGIYGVYDGRRVYAPLFNIIYSGAGNEKGNLIFAKMLAHQVRQEMRRRYEAEKQEYDKAMAEWEAKGKKERGEAPREPVYRDPFVPGNSSSSAVYRALDANGGWGLMFETEADTVTSMIDSDYGNYSDLMRKAHHHESLSMNRVTEKIRIDIDEPRLSIFLTCTPGQMPSLFPSFENGLGSRFLFYHMPDEDIDFHDVFALNDTPLEDTYRKLGDELLPLFHAMQGRTGHPIQFVMSQAQQMEFVNTYREILHEQFGMLGKGIRAFVFRMALECFRYAMILTTLRRLSQWHRTSDSSEPHGIFRDEENALVCDDRDFHTAMTIVGCLINHTARVYAVMAREDDNPFARKNSRLTAEEQQLYNALPEGEFSTARLMDIASSINIPRRTAERMLSKLCNVCRMLMPVRRGVYCKHAVSES